MKSGGGKCFSVAAKLRPVGPSGAEGKRGAETKSGVGEAETENIVRLLLPSVPPPASFALTSPLKHKEGSGDHDSVTLIAQFCCIHGRLRFSRSKGLRLLSKEKGA